VPKSNPTQFPLPDAATLLGALCRALNVSLPKKRKESGQKYLTGTRRLPASTREPLLASLVDARYLPARADKETVELISRGLASAIAAWDRLIGHETGHPFDDDVERIATRYLRLAAIDFAIRAAALDVLLDVPASPPALDSSSAVPDWARAGGLRAKLRALPNALGTTRAKFAARGEPSSKRFDEVFDGRNRSSISKLTQFATTAAKLDKTQAPAETWRVHLLWDFALDAICNKLESRVQRESIKEIAAGFRRIRSTTRRHLRAKYNLADAQARDVLGHFVVEGAKAPDSAFFDKLVREEARWKEMASALAALASGSVPESDRELSQHTAWARSLRACRANWLLCEVSERIALDTESMPLDAAERLANALQPDAAPNKAEALREHPEAMLWASRLVVEQAFLRGILESVLPMVAAFAHALRHPAMYYDAAIIHASAGRIDDALHYVGAIGTAEPFATLAQPLAALLHAMSGAYEDALRDVDALSDHDQTLAFASGVALRGLGRPQDALRVFEEILGDTPKHALALEEATKCCDDLARSARGGDKARWTTRANRYAKAAAQWGRQVGATHRDRLPQR
jgi:tetratricopeptide (TPR) repeat protein